MYLHNLRQDLDVDNQYLQGDVKIVCIQSLHNEIHKQY